MFVHIVLASLQRRRRRKFAALISIALATGIATGLFNLFLSVGDRVRAEFLANRHNILIEPAVEGGYLRESDLTVIKRDLFWRNNIRSFAPLLSVEANVDGRGTATIVGTRWKDGLDEIARAWRIQGRGTDDAALVGSRVAGRWGTRPGDTLTIGGLPILVSGVAATGEDWDDQVIVPLGFAQRVAGLADRVQRVLVNAVTTPDSVLVEKFRKDPKSLSPQDYEKMYCTPFADTIAMELREKIPNSEARPVRKVTETEGPLLRRVNGVLLVLAIAALVAGGVSVMSAMTATVVDRRREIGLLKALGATSATVVLVFVAEAALLALAGSAIGYFLGWGTAMILGASLFGHAMGGSLVAYLLSLAAAAVVAIGGMLVPLRLAVRVDPTRVLHEG